MSHNGTLGTIANWYINVVATFGWLPVLAVETVACTAALCGLGLLFGGGTR